jgi:hypothetical protein
MKENEDFIILKAGYNEAINEVLETIDKNIYLDEENKKVLQDMILRKQRQHWIGNTEYEGFLYKYYDEKTKIGYIIFDDIYELKGVCIFIEEGKFKKIDEKELIFARNNYKIIASEKFSNKDLIYLRYTEWLSKFREM